MGAVQTEHNVTLEVFALAILDVVRIGEELLGLAKMKAYGREEPAVVLTQKTDNANPSVKSMVRSRL